MAAIMRRGNNRSTASRRVGKMPMETDDKSWDIKSSIQTFLENSSKGIGTSEEVIKELKVLNWAALSTSTLNELKAFIVQLVTLNAYYLKPVLQSLLQKFIPDEDPKLSLEQMLADNRNEPVHAVIQAILKLIPMSVGVFHSLITGCIPHITRPTYEQVYCIINLLRIIAYLPTHQKHILEVIMSHITKLDVHVPKQEVIKMFAEKNDVEQFEMEVDTKSETVPESLLQNSTNTLDSLMTIMFEYVTSICYTKDKLNFKEARLLYHDLMSVFDKLILPTYDSCHVQFLIFYLCSFKKSLADTFLDYLWKKFTNPNTASILRQASVAYMGSFLTRSNYISFSSLRKYLLFMSQWIHLYIESDSDSSRIAVDPYLHGPFYAICQTSFYVFAFLHKQLLETPKGHIFLRKLNFQRMVTCQLNPLRVCAPSVIRKFASITRNYQLVYCYTIIERNNRASLPVSSTATNSQLITNPLDSFYPFDSYILPFSKVYVESMISVYQSGGEDEEPKAQDVEEDDFLDAPLVSPDIGSSLPECIVFGTSPEVGVLPT